MMNLQGTEFVRAAREQPGTHECDPSYVCELSPTSDVDRHHHRARPCRPALIELTTRGAR